MVVRRSYAGLLRGTYFQPRKVGIAYRVVLQGCLKKRGEGIGILKNHWGRGLNKNKPESPIEVTSR